jgi:hypothetical protein
MISTATMIEKLQNDTIYTIELSRDKEPNLQDLEELPIIYVGYASIDAKNPHAPIESSFFNLHGEDLVQAFDIMTVCEAENLPEIWKNIYTSLIGFNPVPGEEYRSGLTYAQGGVIGLSNGKIWWLDRWKIGFPTVFVQF